MIPNRTSTLILPHNWMLSIPPGTNYINLGALDEPHPHTGLLEIEYQIQIYSELEPNGKRRSRGSLNPTLQIRNAGGHVLWETAGHTPWMKTPQKLLMPLQYKNLAHSLYVKMPHPRSWSYNFSGYFTTKCYTV